MAVPAVILPSLKSFRRLASMENMSVLVAGEE
jgi:hypothetical protein